MPDDFPVVELHNIIKGDAKGRSNERQVTIFDSVGFAVQDFSLLRYMYDKINGTDFYETLNIIGELDDPRNLFGLIKK